MLCSYTKCVNCTPPMCVCARYTPKTCMYVHLRTTLLATFIYAQHHKPSAYSITTRACAQVLNPSSHTDFALPYKVT